MVPPANPCTDNSYIVPVTSENTSTENSKPGFPTELFEHTKNENMVQINLHNMPTISLTIGKSRYLVVVEQYHIETKGFRQ